jgi:hypothetical protein
MSGAVLCCAKCGVPLEIGKVEVTYLDNTFPVEIPKCPRCGQIYIPEELALGKMLEVEKNLEDK